MTVSRINREVIEEVRASASIVDVVAPYVSLRKSGKNYLGLCPFHTEKTPSFTVSDEKQIFHCFGCGASGSVFDFLMRVRNLDFSEAVKELANRYNIPLPQRQETKETIRRRQLGDELRRINELAADYFHLNLLESDSGAGARKYLSQRGIHKEVIEVFRLGYALPRWDGLKSRLLERRVNTEMAVQAGLLVPKSQRDFYDRFRNRLMFPIRDTAGRVVGFGGRALDESLPKYLNSPDTTVFHKGRVLYGLTTAKEACRENGEVLVVEGYFDLLALYSQGIHQVVAPLGTALTRQHIRLLSRLAPQAVLVFDGDEAGQKAAMRSLELFLREKVPVRMLTLPNDMDPDDYLQQEGKEPFKQKLSEARPLMEMFLEKSLGEHPGNAADKLEVVRVVKPMLQLLDSTLMQETYLRLLSERLGVSEAALWEELGSSGGPFPVRVEQRRGDRSDRIQTWEEEVIHILFHYSQWIPTLEKGQILEQFQGDVWRALGELLLKHYRSTGNLDLGGLLVELQDERLREAVSGWSLESSPWPEEDARLRLEERLEAIRSGKRRLEDDLRRLQEEIQAAERNQDEALLAELLAKKQAKKLALLAKGADDKNDHSKGEMV
jgi:DNA primase